VTIALAALAIVLLLIINRRIYRMSLDIDRLSASVAALTTAADSLIALLVSTVAELKSAASNSADPDIQIQLNALADKADAETAKIAAALAETQPAATPAPDPAPFEPSPAPELTTETPVA